jgi:FAD/FMN-containing dehydrogenase
MLDQLKNIVGATGILSSPSDMKGYLEDWRGRYRGDAICVVLPSTTDQVAAIVRLCYQTGTPVVPQGGNTSLCGGAVPSSLLPPPLIISLQRMRHVRSVDAVNNTLCVDAGCTLSQVQETAFKHERLYPISFGAEGSCQIGGTISTNAGGTGVLLYGNTRDNVLGLEVVLPDGRIWNGLNALHKNNTGYDLKQLFIGAEGTLGIVTAATLKLHPLTRVRSVAWLAVPDPTSALRVFELFRETSKQALSGFELMNSLQVELVLEHVSDRRAPIEASAWHVLVELSNTIDQTTIDEAMENILAQSLEAGYLLDAVIATSETQCAAMWEFRHSISEANRKGGVGLTSDTAVPVSALPVFIENASIAVRAIVPNLRIAIVSHLGDGNVHFIPYFSHAEWALVTNKKEVTDEIRRAVNDSAVSLNGTFSAEHGIGQMLIGEMSRYKSSVELELMHAIKRCLDPSGIFNPGRLLPPEAK